MIPSPKAIHLKDTDDTMGNFHPITESLKAISLHFLLIRLCDVFFKETPCSKAHGLKKTSCKRVRDL